MLAPIKLTFHFKCLISITTRDGISPSKLKCIKNFHSLEMQKWSLWYTFVVASYKILLRNISSLYTLTLKLWNPIYVCGFRTALQIDSCYIGYWTLAVTKIYWACNLVSISSTFLYPLFFADILAPKITKLKRSALQFCLIRTHRWASVQENIIAYLQLAW